jgi:hypothetical protein
MRRSRERWTTWRLGEKRKNGGVTPVNLERMVYL